MSISYPPDDGTITPAYGRDRFAAAVEAVLCTIGEPLVLIRDPHAPDSYILASEPRLAYMVQIRTEPGEPARYRLATPADITLGGSSTNIMDQLSDPDRFVQCIILR